jgi:hypothetical protein
VGLLNGVGMKKAMKDAWLVALRSGKYKQAAGHLTSVDGKCHCVLGVLCLVADVAHDKGPFGPPSVLYERTGLDRGYGADLMQLNDYKSMGFHKYNFAKLADIIEMKIYAS